jgi:hypothetical protein
MNFESTAAKDIHVIGDAMQLARACPRAATWPTPAKVAAAAIRGRLNGWPSDPSQVLTTPATASSTRQNVIHVASVHE